MILNVLLVDTYLSSGVQQLFIASAVLGHGSLNTTTLMCNPFRYASLPATTKFGSLTCS